MTSAQLTADQTAVTAAESQVTDAKQALAEANLTSPITGVVASVDLSVGQQVSGGGSSGSSGSGGGSGSGSLGSGASGRGLRRRVVDRLVGLNRLVRVKQFVQRAGCGHLDQRLPGERDGGRHRGRLGVKAGDQAQIVPDGATTPVYGVVSSVGLIASTTSGLAATRSRSRSTATRAASTPGQRDRHPHRQALNNVTTVPTGALHYTSAGVGVYEMVNDRHVALTVTVGWLGAGKRRSSPGCPSAPRSWRRSC